VTYPRVLVRGEESAGRVGMVESVLPPEWASGDIPPVTRLGPPLGEAS